MTTLQEALDKLEKYQKSLVEIRDDLAFSKRFAIDEIGRSVEALRTALAQQDDSLQAKYLKSELAHTLAQQGEQPTQRQLDTAMRQWETWKAYALELQAKVVKYEGGSPMLLNAAAPAQQWEPVAWYEYNQDLDAWFLAYGHNPKAKTRPLVFGDTAAPAPQAQQGEPVAQARLGMKDGLAMALSVVELYGMKGDVIYREIAKLRDGIAAAPAPQAQDWKKEPEYVPPLVKWAQEQPAPQAQQGEPVCAGCGIPAGDVHMSTCKSGKWPSRVSNGDTAAPAPQPEPAGWQKI